MSEVVTANKAAGFPDRVREYIDGLRDEMRLVTWPSWTQVRATTAVVIGAVSFALQVVWNRALGDMRRIAGGRWEPAIEPRAAA